MCTSKNGKTLTKVLDAVIQKFSHLIIVLLLAIVDIDKGLHLAELLLKRVSGHDVTSRATSRDNGSLTRIRRNESTLTEISLTYLKLTSISLDRDTPCLYDVEMMCQLTLTADCFSVLESENNRREREREGDCF